MLDRACMNWREQQYSMVVASTVAHPWYGMVDVCEGAPVAVGGWVLTDRHDRTDLAPCAANSLHRGTTFVNNVTGGTGEHSA